MKFLKSGLALLAAFTFFSCSESTLDSLEEDSTVHITTIKAVLPETVQTRVSFTDDEENSVIKTAWEEGDEVVVLSPSGQDVTYTLSSGAGTKVATFSGNGSFTEGDVLSVVTKDKSVDYTYEYTDGEWVVNYYMFTNTDIDVDAEDAEDSEISPTPSVPSGLFVGSAEVIDSGNELMVSNWSPLNAIMKLELDLNENPLEPEPNGIEIDKADIEVVGTTLPIDGFYNLNTKAFSLGDWSYEDADEESYPTLEWYNETFVDNKFTIYFPVVPGTAFEGLTVKVYPLDEDGNRQSYIDNDEEVTVCYYYEFDPFNVSIPIPQAGKIYVKTLKNEEEKEGDVDGPAGWYNVSEEIPGGDAGGDIPEGDGDEIG